MPTDEETARNWETPASVLQSLFERRRRESDRDNNKVMAALAQNPNTPPDILSRLVFNHAHAFCSNPIAPLILLEKPDFLTRLNSRWQLSILNCANAPVVLVQALLNVTEVSVASEARHHIAFAGELENGQWQKELGKVCRNYCEKTTSPDERQFHSDYAELGFLPAEWPGVVVPIPKISDKTLSDALNGRTWEDAGGRALSRMLAPDIKPALFRILTNSYDTVVHLAFCLHPQTPADVLLEIAGHDYSQERVRLFAARHSNTDAALLAQFAADKNPVLRRLARKHPNAPENVFELSRQAGAKKKGNTPLWYLVSGLHDKLPVKDLRTRLTSPYWMVRLSAVFAITNGLVRLSDERREMLDYLTGDANRFVRAAAQTGLADPTYRFSFE